MGSDSMPHVQVIQGVTARLGVVQRAATIRRQNDEARVYARAGTMYVTRGIMALGKEQLAHVLRAVRTYNGFSADNDPYDEHDMGLVDVAGERILWKIDYYDTDRRYGSPDPADPTVTTRVLTIMLASEY